MRTSNTSTPTADELRAQAGAILNRPTLSKEDTSRVTGLLDLANQLDGREDRLREIRVRRELGLPVREETDPKTAAFRHFLRTGDMSESGGNALQGSGGAYIVPVNFEATALEALKLADQLCDRNAVTWIEANDGRPLTLPVVDDTTVDGEEPGEGSQDNAIDIAALGSVVLPEAIKMRSKFIKVSIELFQDSGVNLDDFLASAFGKRLARKIGNYLVGVLMAGAANSGVTVVGDDSQGSPAPTTQVGFGDLSNLIDSIDPAYLESPLAAWAMKRSTLTYISNLRDKQNRPLKLVKRDPATGKFWLMDFPVHICPSMDALGASKKPVLIGDFSRLWVRSVKNNFSVNRVTADSASLMVQKLVERFSDYGEVGYFSTMRVSAGVAAVGSQSTPPFVYLQNHS